MAKTNVAAKRHTVRRDARMLADVRVAGGSGALAAKQGTADLLRRAVMGCLLWENLFYESGEEVAQNIKRLIPLVDPKSVYEIAIEARTVAKMRHVPLFIAREMARLDTHKSLVGDLLPRIILRADELTEFLAIYWKDDPEQPLSKQVKVGLARAFNSFNEYKLAKYNRDGVVTLRDVVYLTHVNPADAKGRGRKAKAIKRSDYKRGDVLRHRNTLVSKLLAGELKTPDTWEVGLSAGENKKLLFERLLMNKGIGGLAFLRNLRGMEEAGVSRSAIEFGFKTVNPGWLLPMNYLIAAKYAPKWEREIEGMMLRGLGSMPKLPGHTVIVVDVSGSTRQPVSEQSELSCLDGELAMAMLAAEVCESISVYATAGNDSAQTHKTALVKPRHGFALMDEIRNARSVVGDGGIFTRQALEYIQKREGSVDRIIVFSDSQDMDRRNPVPAPFGKVGNYIVNVAAHKHGINYKNIWTAEISGYSEKFIAFIAALEGIGMTEEEQE